MTTEPTVIYEPRKPRYILQHRDPSKGWQDAEGYHDLGTARREADERICMWPNDQIRVIDTRPGEPEPTQIF